MSARGRNWYKGNARVTRRPESCPPIARSPPPVSRRRAPRSRTGRAICAAGRRLERPRAALSGPRDGVRRRGRRHGRAARERSTARSTTGSSERRVGTAGVPESDGKSHRPGRVRYPSQLSEAPLTRSKRLTAEVKGAVVSGAYRPGPRSRARTVPHDPADLLAGCPVRPGKPSGPRCRVTIWEEGLRDRTPPDVFSFVCGCRRRLERCRPAFSGAPLR